LHLAAAAGGHGTVVSCATVRWAGGPTLEATLSDGTGTLLLAFPGRGCVGGVEPGRHLVAGGTVARHRGRLALLHPYLWLAP
jgi:hypothetical protein